MAISIDKVYQRVLALANKEQRGYITPQEFNLLAGQAQSDIFESYFHDKKSALQIPGNQSKASDDVEMLRDKIAIHRKTDISGTNAILPFECHWLESVYKEPTRNIRTISIKFSDATDIGLGSGDVLPGHIALFRMSSNGLMDGSIMGGVYSSSTSSDPTGPVGEYIFKVVFKVKETDGTLLTNLEHPDLVGGTPPFHSVIVFKNYTASQVAEAFVNSALPTSQYISTIDSTDPTVVNIRYVKTKIWELESLWGQEQFENYTNSNLQQRKYVNSGSEGNVIYEEVDREQWVYIKSNKKLAPTKDSRGIYYKSNALQSSQTQLEVFPTLSISDALKVDYIKKPADPKWAYVVVNNKALYNPNLSTNSLLHASEEGTLTNKILELAGIVINKPGLSEVILRNEQLKEAKEIK
jgi:hypothetical protein